MAKIIVRNSDNLVVFCLEDSQDITLTANECKFTNGNGTDTYVLDINSSTHTVYTDPLVEPEEDKWILYSAKDVRSKSKPIFEILPIIDSETLIYIKEKLMIPTFLLLEKAWKKFNVSLIDMKIEVGYTKEKELVIADVIDNDSWRIWPHGDPKRQLDKQSFRDGEEMTEVQKKYKIVTEYVKEFNEISS